MRKGIIHRLLLSQRRQQAFSRTKWTIHRSFSTQLPTPPPNTYKNNKSTTGQTEVIKLFKQGLHVQAKQLYFSNPDLESALFLVKLEGDFKYTQRIYQRFIEQQDSIVLTLEFMRICLQKFRKTEEADKLYEKVLASYEKIRAEQSYKNALVSYEKIRSQEPNEVVEVISANLIEQITYAFMGQLDFHNLIGVIHDIERHNVIMSKGYYFKVINFARARNSRELSKALVDHLQSQPKYLSSLILMLRKCRMYDAAISLFNQVPIDVRGTSTWDSTVQILCKLNRLNDAVDLLSEMKQREKQLSSHAYSALLKACSKKRDYGKALEIFNSIPSIMLNDILPLAFDIFYECNTQQAATLFKQIPESKRDISMCNKMLSFYNSTGMIEEAFALFDEMKKSNMKPIAATFISLLDLCSKAGDADRGVKLYSEIPPNLEDVDVHIATLRMFRSIGMISESISLFKRIPQYARSATVYCTMIDACSAAGKPSLTLHLYSEMKTRVQQNVDTYEALLKLGANLNNDSLALQIYSDIPSKELTPELCALAITMLCKCGLVYQATKLFWQISESERTIQLWTKLISSHVVSGKFDMAVKLYSQFINSNLEPNEHLCTYMLYTYGELQDAPAAHKFYSEIPEIHKTSIRVQTAAINMFRKCELLDEACAVFEQTEVQARLVTTWTAMLQVLLGLNKYHELLDLFSQMERHNVTPNTKVYYIMLAACAENQDEQMVRQIHEGMDPMIFEQVMEQFQTHGFNPDNSLQEILEIEEIPSETYETSQRVQHNTSATSGLASSNGQLFTE